MAVCWVLFDRLIAFVVFVNSVVMRVFFVLLCVLIFAVCVILVFGGRFPGFGCGYCAGGWFGISVGS